MERSRFLESLIKEAKAEGFPLAGALDFDRVPVDVFKSHLNRYDRWVETGNAGEMQYLVRGRDRRADPKLVFPDAKSILSVAIPYPTQSPGKADSSRYARYLQGRDYHLEISEKLERAMAKVNAAFPDAGIRWKVCVDTSAVLERTWASLVGLGWIGKNTLLIHPQFGSYLFLGSVLINQEVGAGMAPLPNYCGNCTRCLDACPTSAFTSPGILDSRKCISYLTLEKRGVLEITEDQKNKMGSWVAGCDICQEVCPFNTKASKATSKSSDLKSDDDATRVSDWIELLRETEEQYRERVRRSSLKRVKPAQFRRNLAIALSNFIRGDGAAKLSTEELYGLKQEVITKLASETDEVPRQEWNKCLADFKLSR